MKTTFTLLTALLLFNVAGKVSAQLLGPSPKSERDIMAEFASACGQLPALTTDPSKAMIYITFDNAGGQAFATTNFKTDTTIKAFPILHLQSGMTNSAELQQLFDGAAGGFTLAELPILIHNDVFRVFLDTRFLDRYKNVSVVSEQWKRYPIRNRMAELRPGFFVTPSIVLDNLESFLFERGFDPAETEVLSLLNNKETNDAIAAVFADFQAIRTVDQIEKAFEQSKKKSVCLVGHIRADGQIVRYRSNGEVSYELPVTQFLHLASDLHKEVILIGCNFADDTSRTLDVAAEIKLLEASLGKRLWGEVLQDLAGAGNQVQVTEPNTDGFYFKRAEVSRPEGVKPARAYTLIFFKTPAKPSTAIATLRFVYGHSGKILSVLAILQLLFFFVFKGRWASTLRWVNLALLFVFLFAFLFSIR